MKRPTAASLKKVTAENLAGLGAERLAELLVAAAQSRPELKRRLRMELAAEQGAEHLLAEIDRRLNSLQSSRSKVSWRQRPTFVRDLDGLRVLIAQRLAGWTPRRRWIGCGGSWSWPEGWAGGCAIGTASSRRCSPGPAGDIGGLVAASGVEGRRGAGAGGDARPGRVDRVAAAGAGAGAARTGAHRAGDDEPPGGRRGRLDAAAAAVGRRGGGRGRLPRHLLGPGAAHAGGGGEVARRLLAAGRVEEAGSLLRAAAEVGRGGPDFGWESAWIDYLDASGEAEAAQAARWSSFERTLAAERLRAFTRRLADFDDVEAEERAFAYAAAHRDLQRALRFLMEWPALPEAAALVQARAGASAAAIEPHAEGWAERLRARQPRAAAVLLRIAAQAAYRRRDRAAGERLTQEAEGLG
jgi:hypothetical protein